MKTCFCPAPEKRSQMCVNPLFYENRSITDIAVTGG